MAPVQLTEIVRFATRSRTIAGGEGGVVSIELEYAPNPDQIVEWVEEAYRETAKLMDLVGLRDPR